VGDVGGAEIMLGRPYSVTSAVLSGKKLGRDIGFPTANICFPASSAVVKHGIYAVRCTTESGEEYIGTANVGVRPSIDDSIDDHTVNCETYIHGFCGDLYGKTLTVSFCAFLRPEMRFDSLESLKAAIARDVESTVKFFEQK
jgi:riboflavin kinase/FMN adenylyltransferase